MTLPVAPLASEALFIYTYVLASLCAMFVCELGLTRPATTALTLDRQPTATQTQSACQPATSSLRGPGAWCGWFARYFKHNAGPRRLPERHRRSGAMVLCID